MVLSQRDQKVQAFPPQRAQEPLAEGIRLGTLRRGFEDPQSQVAYVLVDRLRKDGIAVVDQETIIMVWGNRVAQLLQRP
jgi:hypothetical protein